MPDWNDVVSISDFSQKDIELVLDTAIKLQSFPESQKRVLLEGKTLASLFFEPSTRTRLSFETAAQNLGCRVIGFADSKSSSTAKGESVSDTVRMASSYADFIVIRHFLEGVARRAAEVSDVPVINAGDGANHHPTQALLDLFTIRQKLGRLHNISIAAVGDLKYGRAIQSTLLGLSMFENNRVFLVSPDSLQLPEKIFNKINDKMFVQKTSRIEEAVSDVDILYVTRIQKERFSDPYEFEKVNGIYRVTPQTFASNPRVGIMHPLPRLDEISIDVDHLKNAWYFEQAANGVPVREALLYLLSEVKK